MHATIPKGIVGSHGVHFPSKKFERMSREAMDVCLRVLEQSNKSGFDTYSVRNSVLIISHITFRDCRVHFFSDNLSRNSRVCGLVISLQTNNQSECDTSFCTCEMSIYKLICKIKTKREARGNQKQQQKNLHRLIRTNCC